MFAATGGNQRAQFLLGLQLRQTVQIQKQLRRIIATAQFLRLKMADIRANIFDRTFGIQ